MTRLKGWAYWGAVGLLVLCLLLTWQQPSVEAQSGLPPQHGGLGFGVPGGTFTGGTITTPILAPAADNCASVPYSFTGDTDTGLCSPVADGWALKLAGLQVFYDLGGNPTFYDGFDISGTPGAAGDVKVHRDAANTLALRNSTNAQKFIVQGTYTDGSNQQWGFIDQGVTTADALTLGCAKLGSPNYCASIKLSQNGSVIATYTNTDWSGIADQTVLGSTSAFKEANVNRAIQGSKTKALTDGAAAAAFVRIAVPQTVGSNYAGGDVVWTAFAADATPHTQSLSGRLTFTSINNAGTEVCAVDPTAAVTAPNANSSGTLACTFSCASNAADTIDLMATCDTSLGTPTALSLLYRLDMPQPNTVTPQ